MRDIICYCIVYYLISTNFCIGIFLALSGNHIISDDEAAKYVLITLLVGWIFFPYIMGDAYATKLLESPDIRDEVERDVLGIYTVENEGFFKRLLK